MDYLRLAALPAAVILAFAAALAFGHPDVRLCGTDPTSPCDLAAGTTVGGVPIGTAAPNLVVAKHGTGCVAQCVAEGAAGCADAVTLDTGTDAACVGTVATRICVCN